MLIKVKRSSCPIYFLNLNIDEHHSLFLLQVDTKELSYFFDELDCLTILFTGDVGGVQYADGQVLSHETFFNGFNDGGFQRVAEMLQLLVMIKLCSVQQSSGPSVNASNRVS